MKSFSPRALLRWYGANKRRLPWRRTADPYRIWVSEVMLQQTQVDRMAVFYPKFLKKFPSVRALARASWQQILGAVRGMGYYGRFRNVRTAARAVVKNFGGKFPADYGKLRTLPGVGDYTANAILCFAFGRDAPVMDTNVRRVLRHFYGKKTDKTLKRLAMELCPKGRSRYFFQALMDFASAHKKLFLQPRKKSRSPQTPTDKKKPTVRVAAGIIRHCGKILIQRRPRGRHLAGFWEFPGGKIEPREDARACLKREIKEELGIEVAVRPPFLQLRHAYRDRAVHLTFHRCSILLGRPRAREKQTFAWIAPAELRRYRLAPADAPVVARLLQ